MDNQKRIFRFSIFQRIEHIVLLISFTTLGLTGIPQKYAEAGISQWVIAFAGGIEVIRIIHRSAATIFVLQSIYHFVMVGYKLYVLRKEATMLPNLKDLTDAFQAFFYNLGFSKTHPKLPRYSFAEKAEYWALLWGLLVMAATGFMLWNPISTAKFLPGAFIPAAKAAHGGEAVLAVLAIIIWHFYMVHIKHLNLAMFLGSMTREEMHEEHAQELEEIEAGKVPPSPTPAMIKRRRAIYTPIAAAVVVVALVVIFEFTTAESTAITTLPVDVRGEIYVPQTPTPLPPTPVPELNPTASPDILGTPITPVTWNGGIAAIFNANCGSCHGTAAGLDLQSYTAALKGSTRGAVIVPGDADNSLVIIRTKDGTHSGKFNGEEMQAIIAWIKAGAMEK